MLQLQKSQIVQIKVVRSIGAEETSNLFANL